MASTNKETAIFVVCTVPVGKQLVAKVDKGKRKSPVRVHSPLSVSFLFCQYENLKSIFFFLEDIKEDLPGASRDLLCVFSLMVLHFHPLHRPSTSYSVAVFRP